MENTQCSVSRCHDSLLNSVVDNDSNNCANFINSSDKLFREAVKSKKISKTSLDKLNSLP